MTVSKRVGACLLALVLVVHLVFPIRARAMATAAMSAVGVGVTVAAFLSLCKVYPYIAGSDSISGGGFDVWENESLRALWNQYAALNSVTPFANLKSYAMNGVIVVGSKIWSELRGFAEWLKETFALQDNQTGVELADYGGVLTLPVFEFPPTVAEIQASGILINGSKDGWYLANYPHYAGVSVANIRGFYLKNSQNPRFVAVTPFMSSFEFYEYNRTEGMRTYATPSARTFRGVTYYYTVSLECLTPSGAFATYSSLDDGFWNVWGQMTSLPPRSVTVDTGKIAIPDELPEGTDFAGMRVGGANVGTTVEDIIESGVEGRTEPLVAQVPVEITEGVTVDAETGEITEDSVVLDPEMVIPSVSALTAPQALLTAFGQALTTKFPFCLYFDAMRLLRAFAFEPVAPVISLTFHDSFTDADYSITVDFSPWNEVASIVRMFESMILLVAFAMNAPKVILFKDMVTP